MSYNGDPLADVQRIQRQFGCGHDHGSVSVVVGDSLPSPTNEPERFYLDQDCSGHWFVVPVAKRDEWNAWTRIGEEDPENEDGWEAPPWARPVGGSPTLVAFTAPEIA